MIFWLIYGIIKTCVTNTGGVCFMGDGFHYPALFGHPFASEGDLMRHQYWWRLFYGRWFPLPHPVRAPLRQRRGFNLAKLKQKGFLHDTCFTNQTWHICCA